MNATTPVVEVTMQLALGRIFRLLSRPYQPGDVSQYEAARAAVLAHSPTPAPDYTPNYARDWNRGALGDAA